MLHLSLMNERRIITAEQTAELTRKWGERSKGWEDNAPTTEDLFELAFDILDIRRAWGLSGLDGESADISTDKICMIAVDHRDAQILLKGSVKIAVFDEQTVSASNIQEVTQLSDARGFSDIMIHRGVSYISPATGYRINPFVDKMYPADLTPEERIALAKLMWQSHLKKDAPMTGVLQPQPQA